MAVLAHFKAPWRGMDTSLPPNNIDPSYAVDMENFIPYEGMLQVQSYTQFGDVAGVPDGNPIEAVVRFFDQNNVAHYVVITKANLYAEVTPTSYGTAYPLPATGTSLTNWVVFENRLFFVNGTNYVLYFDGTTLNTATDQYGAKYIFELASSIVIANTYEAVGGLFQQRVRWCVAGNYTQWDPGTYDGAGFEDLLETPDGITGVLNTNPVAYILRSNGITQMIPTGIGTSAFNFNHLWASQRGIGNILAYGGNNYGPGGFVVANDDIYIISSSGYQAVGGKIKNRLYADLQTYSTGVIIGWVESVIAAAHPVLRYRISMTRDITSTDSIIWSFDTDSNSWYKETVFYGVTGVPGYLDTLEWNGDAISTPLIPCDYYNPVTGSTHYQLVALEVLSEGGGNSVWSEATYIFKTLYDEEDKSLTTRFVKVRYQYLGNTSNQGVPCSLTISGMYGTPVSRTVQLSNPSYTKAQCGGALPPSNNNGYYNIYVPIVFTDQEITLKLVLDAPLNTVGAGNSVHITDVVIFGELGKEVVR
jgi:hypothetical protein